MNPADLGRKIRGAFGARSLGCWPTPLERAAVLAERTGAREVWVKREDRSADAYGGNKVRGLEFLFSGLEAGDAVVTVGGCGSTHCLATARHARALGAHAVIAQFPQGASDTAAATERAVDRWATARYAARTWAGFPLAWLRAWRHAGRLGPRRRVPGGGAAPVAVLGHALAVLELADQLPSGPEAVVTPLGSGGTAAGILLGCELLGWRPAVYAARVAPRVVANRRRVERLRAASRRLLREHGVGWAEGAGSPRLVIVDAMGRGYGQPTDAGERARGWAREAGFETDSTYGGKALAAVPAVTAAGHGRLVYWHTYARPDGE